MSEHHRMRMRQTKEIKNNSIYIKYGGPGMCYVYNC